MQDKTVSVMARQDEVFYTSPTVKYAGLKFYAEPQLFLAAGADGQKRPMAGSIALQCRQKPGSFEMQGETMGFNRQWVSCAHTADPC